MAKVTAEEYQEKLGVIKNFYTYHQIQRDPSHIEFGWVDIGDVSDILHAAAGPVVLATDPEDSSWDNLTTLSDYETFFSRLTSLNPSDFIERWSLSPRELQAFWQSSYPNAPEDQHEFIMKLAHLILDGTSFEMYGKEYEVFELESGEDDEEGGDKA
jgi:hypothetical protein